MSLSQRLLLCSLDYHDFVARLRGSGPGAVPASVEYYQVLRLVASSAGPRAAQTQSRATSTRSTATATTASQESDVCCGTSATAWRSPGLVLALHMTPGGGGGGGVN
eukprot:scaffold7151_cov159-Ochromonas_danica.AAC.9